MPGLCAADHSVEHLLRQCGTRFLDLFTGLMMMSFYLI